jgi:hypothetical protein
MMYKTPTFAEPQQYNRPFSTGQLSAFIIQTGNLDVTTPQWKKKYWDIRKIYILHSNQNNNKSVLIS